MRLAYRYRIKTTACTLDVRLSKGKMKLSITFTDTLWYILKVSGEQSPWQAYL